MTPAEQLRRLQHWLHRSIAQKARYAKDEIHFLADLMRREAASGEFLTQHNRSE